MTRILFKNANVFDGLTPHLLPSHDVLVEDGLIKELTPRRSVARPTASSTSPDAR